MHPIQIILVGFALFGLFRVWSRRRRQVGPGATLVFWTLIWLAVIGGTVYPAATTVIARFFGVTRGADLVLYLAMALVFYQLFRVYARFEDYDRQISLLIRMQSLQRFEQEFGPFPPREAAPASPPPV